VSDSSAKSLAATAKDTTIPRRCFDKSLVPAIGSKPVREVAPEGVRTIVSREKHEGFDVAAGVLLGVLTRLFDYAITAGLTVTDPVMALPMRHVQRARSHDRALAPQEICVFLTAVMASNVRRQFKVALRLILLTLVRKSELMLARWEYVDTEKAAWRTLDGLFFCRLRWMHSVRPNI
jgi:integrase